MKKQICFAGFTEEEAAALRPALSALSGAWDCAFIPDAATTLATLADTPFDALLASLSENGIRDTDLLQHAAAKQPCMLRFAIGEAGDRELMVHCMGAANQFISKPWKPRELTSIIERSLALDAWLSNDKLRSFVPRLGRLPGLPSSYFEVLKKAESPNASVDSIADVIARDPALTARLLQMVNSPACGLAEKITSPNDAVSMLGVEAIKSIVLCLQLFAQSEAKTEASLSLDQLWRHSFRVAKLAGNIVLRCIGSERMASEAYTAGLLHNIGQIVLATNLCNEYSVVVDTARNIQCSLREAEMKLLGVTMNQVGAYLLGLWGMPLPLLESTALHDTPGSTGAVEFSVLTAVHVANVLAYEESGQLQGVPVPKLDAEYLATLDLPAKTDAWRKFMAASPKHDEVTEGEAADCSSSAAVARASASRSGRNFALVAVAAVIAAAAVAYWRGLLPIGHKVASAAVAAKTSTAPASAQAAAGEKPKPATDASAFDSIRIQGIVYHAGHSVALINGQTLDVGERINGVQVISIERSNVVLACNGLQKTFKLK
ncbi:MAG TPA: HDOD domain-containing protein [Verrucomicrobiae bacterium]